MAHIPTIQPLPFKRAGWFRRAWFRFRHLPKYVVIGGAIFLLALLSSAGYYGYQRHVKSEAAKANGERWGKFEEAVRKGDEAGMIAALQEIVRANPDDPVAARRLRSIEAGDAEPNDGETALLTYQSHLRAVPPRWAEADREARKRLEHFPNDWLARCVTAQAALTRKNPLAAAQELDALPDPNRPDVNIQPGSLLFAFNLYAETRRDPAPLRQFVATRVVDRIRSPDSKTWPLGLKLPLIECYLRAYDPGAEGQQLEGLNRAASSLGDMTESCLQDAVAAKDGAALQRLAILCNQLGGAFTLMLKDGRISEDQYAALVADFDGRNERIARAMLELNPKSVPGYKGVAIAELRRKNPAKALEIIADGLKQCGDNTELLALYSHLLRAGNAGGEAVRVMTAAAEKDPKNLDLWLQLAEAAAASGELGKAGNAVSRASALAPDDPRALRLAAGLALVNAEPTKAVLLLDKLGDNTLARDPKLARWYVAALIDGSLTHKLPAFLKSVEEVSVQANQPAPIGYALRGINDSTRFDYQASKAAIAIVDRLLIRWPDQLDLLMAQTMAHYRIAQNSVPMWELGATKDAIRALMRLRDKVPDNPDIAASIAWIRLKGEKRANLALIDARALADLRKNELPLSAWQMQVLGWVYYANDRNADAISVLEKARDSGARSAGVLIALALAYNKEKRWDDAKATIQMAQAQSDRNAQEQADYKEAVLIVPP